MVTINNNWQNSNENRAFPFEESCSLLSDTGVRLPDSAIVTARIRFPVAIGTRMALSSLTVGAAMVSATFTAYSASLTTPIAAAAVTVQQPVVPGKSYPVTAISSGVVGWVVFGSYVVEPTAVTSFRFSNPTAVIIPEQASAFKAYPVQGIRTVMADGYLTGDVKITGSSCATAIVSTSSIAGKICIEIKADTDSRPTALKDLVGPCGNSPFNRRCGTYPVTQISGAIPDANGNITLDFDSAIFDTTAATGKISISTTEIQLSQSSYCAIAKQMKYNTMAINIPTVGTTVFPTFPAFPSGTRLL